MSWNERDPQEVFSEFRALSLAAGLEQDLLYEKLCGFKLSYLDGLDIHTMTIEECSAYPDYVSKTSPTRVGETDAIIDETNWNQVNNQGICNLAYCALYAQDDQVKQKARTNFETWQKFREQYGAPGEGECILL